MGFWGCSVVFERIHQHVAETRFQRENTPPWPHRFPHQFTSTFFFFALFIPNDNITFSKMDALPSFSTHDTDIMYFKWYIDQQICVKSSNIYENAPWTVLHAHVNASNFVSMAHLNKGNVSQHWHGKCRFAPCISFSPHRGHSLDLRVEVETLGTNTQHTKIDKK